MTGPSFRFRLERVRALRERKEDAAKEALAGALAQQRRCEQELQQAAERIMRAREAHLHAATTSSSANDLVAHQAYLERTESAHRESRRDLDRHELVVDQRRGDLTQAARDRQALERLKAQRRADHVREVAREEAVTLDEIAITSFRRNAA